MSYSAASPSILAAIGRPAPPISRSERFPSESASCPAISRFAPTVTSSASARSARAVSPSAATNICSVSYTTDSDPPPAVAIAPYNTRSGWIAIRKSTGFARGRANVRRASTRGIVRSSSVAAAAAKGASVAPSTPARALRDRTTSRLSARPFNGFFSSWAARPASRARALSQSDGAAPERSLSSVRIVGRGLHRDAPGDAAALFRRRDEALDRVRGPANAQLLEEEAEGLVVRERDLRLHVLRQVPELALEGAERLLAALVVELLIGVALLALIAGVLVEPRVDLRAQGLGDLLVEDVLEVRGEMDLRGLDARKVVEGALGERRRAVLHGAGHPELIARHLRERLERLEIELHVGDAPIGEHDPPVRRARLHGDL